MKQKLRPEGSDFAEVMPEIQLITVILLLLLLSLLLLLFQSPLCDTTAYLWLPVAGDGARCSRSRGNLPGQPLASGVGTSSEGADSRVASAGT